MNKIPVVFTFDKRIILGAAVTIKVLLTQQSLKLNTIFMFIILILMIKLRRNLPKCAKILNIQ